MRRKKDVLGLENCAVAEAASLAQVHSALAFYYDNKAEYDVSIAESLAKAEKLAFAAQNSPGRQRLRALGLLH